MQFRVTWTIDAEADTHEAAAREARAMQIKHGTTARVFDVQEKGTTDDSMVIDMDELHIEDPSDPVRKFGAFVLRVLASSDNWGSDVMNDFQGEAFDLGLATSENVFTLTPETAVAVDFNPDQDPDEDDDAPDLTGDDALGQVRP